MPKEIAAGCRDGGDTWTNWWVYPALTDEQVKDVIEELNLGYFYGGPGRAFGRDPYHKTSKSYTLITQDGGLDV